MNKLFVFLSTLLCIAICNPSFAQHDSASKGGWVGIAGGTIKENTVTKYIPLYDVLIHGKTGGGVDSSEIMNWDSITVISTDSSKMNETYRVVFWQCIRQNERGSATLLSGFDANISDTIKTAALETPVKSLLIFFNIKFVDASGRIRTMDYGPVFRRM